MNIKVIKGGISKPKVGDIIEFLDKSASTTENCFYLICQNNSESKLKCQYFLINLSGKKRSNIRFYDSLHELLEFHKGKYKLYSSDFMEMALVEKEQQYE